MHLDRRTYDALLRGTLPRAEAAALATHLREDCETCARFLIDRGFADRLDGRADAGLAVAFPPAPAARSDLAFARVWRRVRGGWPRRRRSVVIAVAATVMAAGLAGLLARTIPAAPTPPATWDGVKGTGDALLAHLRAARVDGGRGLSALQPGQPLAKTEQLAFELEANRAAHATLLRVGHEGDVERIWRGTVGPGRTVVAVGGKVAAYPVAPLHGAQRFVAILTDSAADLGLVDEAVARLEAEGMTAVATPPPGITFDHIEVSVR